MEFKEVVKNRYSCKKFSADGEKPVDKYFSYLDKEDFVDLVLWVDQVLSQEYEGKTAKKE